MTTTKNVNGQSTLNNNFGFFPIWSVRCACVCESESHEIFFSNFFFRRASDDERPFESSVWRLKLDEHAIFSFQRSVVNYKYVKLNAEFFTPNDVFGQ